MKQETATIIFQPSGRRGSVPRGITIVEASRLLGADIEAPCGDHQICGKCRVRIENGVFEKFGIRSGQEHTSPVENRETETLAANEIEEGYRLGCAATVQGDLLIYIPETSKGDKQVVSKAAGDLDIMLDPAVKLYHIKVPAPTLEDETADFERMFRCLQKEHALSSLEINLYALRSLPGALRTGEWEITVTVWMDKEIIRITPGSTTAGYGMAFDIGTTTIAGYLCDLETGRVIDTVSAMNPQVKYGEDVVSRISYHMGHPDGLTRMSKDVINTINELIEEAVKNVRSNPELQPSTMSGITTDDIIDLAFCSNTAMHHILLQLLQFHYHIPVHHRHHQLHRDQYLIDQYLQLKDNCHNHLEFHPYLHQLHRQNRHKYRRHYQIHAQEQ
ncbi:MAG: 2Fe-2S iron-sulfur cluster binding domain-containing protein [Geobacteraceae bacterium]|nr:2Fe-2S iron-sulfur cluster binding domain-containing protein [Geobacteraceae bacterium]